MTDLSQIGNMLAGFGAGVQGQLPQFLQQQQNQEQLKMQQEQFGLQKQEAQQKLAQERMKTFFLDADAGLKLVNANKPEAFLNLGLQRLQLLKNFPDADPSDTQLLVNLGAAWKNGSAQAREYLKAELENAVTVGKAYGIIQQPKPQNISQSDINEFGQIAQIDPVTGLPKAVDIAGYKPKSVKEPEKFSVLTAEQAAQLGLPADKQFQMNNTTNQISQIGGAGTNITIGQPTEGERTAGILANRLDFAQSQINDVLASAPESKSPKTLPTILSSVGFDYLSRASNPAERQIIEAAQDDMLDAALTLGTGAAYTKEQFQAYKRSYFPQLGDDEKTISAKATRLKNLLDAAYTKAGRAAPDRRKATETPKAQAAKTPTVSTQAEYDALPSGAVYIEDGKQYRKP